MCGIVGYIGDKSAVGIIVDGLKRLEYRGYVSAGVAVFSPNGQLEVRRAAGRIKTLEGILRDKPLTGTIGIGHTRWATHGRPSDENAHPHTDCSGALVVVHNGILENYLEIKERLRDEGHTFKSETDTEVLAHLIEHSLRATPRLDQAVKRALGEFKGSYAVGVVSKAAPDRLVAAKPGAGNVVLPDINLDPATVRAIQRVVFVACGTAYHAGMLGRMMVERLAGVPAEVDLASEFRYRDAVVGPETLIVAVSQSGETADTLGAVKAARLKGCPILAITNVVGSALAREATGTLYMHAGPEIGVASTKAFSTMIVAVYLLGLWLGRQRGVLTAEDVRKRIQDLIEIPRLVGQTLELDTKIAALARHLSSARDFLYLGRGLQFPIALEGALKLKELSYIHAEGYAGGEMKHGPIALITDGLPVVAIAPRDGSYERMLGNVEEVRAREGLVIAIVQAGDRAIASKATHVLEVPPCADFLAPLLTVIPLQLLAYHIAVRRGCDVDQPRNLAKSVTVE